MVLDFAKEAIDNVDSHSINFDDLKAGKANIKVFGVGGAGGNAIPVFGRGLVRVLPGGPSLGNSGRAGRLRRLGQLSDHAVRGRGTDRDRHRDHHCGGRICPGGPDRLPVGAGGGAPLRPVQSAPQAGRVCGDTRHR